MNVLKALIFDVDGTLADTERDGHRVAFNRAFEEAGLPWHWNVETYGALLKVTGGKERIRLFVEKYQPEFDSPPDLGVFIRKLHQSKTRHFVALLNSGAIGLRPGVDSTSIAVVAVLVGIRNKFGCYKSASNFRSFSARELLSILYSPLIIRSCRSTIFAASISGN